MPLIVPTPERKAALKAIHEQLAEYKQSGAARNLERAVVLMAKIPEFARYLSGKPMPGTPLKFAWEFLYFFLYKRDYVSAALILWGPDTFSPEPHSVEMMWRSLFDYSLINVMGAASCGKTFSPSAWALLDWVLDPEWTRVQVVSNSEDHVKKNLFGDLVRLHQEAVLELPGKIDSESISLDKKRAMGIFVLTIPGGPTARGKLKGAKMKNRPPHPLFGRSSRLRVILDEAQEIAPNIWDDVPNLLASVDNSTEHIKILAAANPKAEFSRYGLNCKPTGGWESITDEQDEWESETGWHVISINAMRTENVMQQKTIFPRMITFEGVQKIIRSQGRGNSDHPNCYTYIYGRFPKTSLMGAVIKAEHIRRSEGEWIFDEATRSVAGNDPAYTGDSPTLATGRVGRAIGWIDAAGVRHTLERPRTVVQVDAVGVLERGDMQDMASDILERCRQLSIRPNCFGIDRTGLGQGVHDIVRRQWRAKVGIVDSPNELVGIIGIHYSESATEHRVCEEDTETPKEMYDRIATELYFAAAKLLEHDCVRFGRGIDPKVYEQLAARQGGMQPGLGRKLTLEKKDVFKARTGGHSPDEADAVTIMLHVARISTSNLIPKAKETEEIKEERGSGEWMGGGQFFQGCDFAGFGSERLPNLIED